MNSYFNHNLLISCQICGQTGSLKLAHHSSKSRKILKMLQTYTVFSFSVSHLKPLHFQLDIFKCVVYEFLSVYCLLQVPDLHSSLLSYAEQTPHSNSLFLQIVWWYVMLLE